MDRMQIIKAIRNASQNLGSKRLSIPAFKQKTGISQYTVLKYFDSWSEACRVAGINCGFTRENLKHKSPISEVECISEMQRVAIFLDRKELSTTEFNQLGFEIIGNRSAFPDCQARRKVTRANRERYADCMIEYEFASSDYRKHKHPPSGCDLIVCWRHDWSGCPIEVLVLEDEIKKLDGWK
jgi:hypothetical protein